MVDADDYILELAVPSAAPLSFHFIHSFVQRQLADQGDGARLAPKEKDFLITVEGREPQSVKSPEVPNKLVIPLIQNAYHSSS